MREKNEIDSSTAACKFFPDMLRLSGECVSRRDLNGRKYMKYDVIIIGAGPGGIFSAYELTRLNPALNIAVYEAGNPLDKRHCPIDGVKVRS